MNLTLWIVAHLIGDFLLQNHWMQAKSKSTFVCLAHISAYSIPFIFLGFLGLIPLTALLLILVEHFFQDRFALHLKWMRLYKQTKPDLWPVGPLCIDQSWHIVFIEIVFLAFNH